MKFREAMKDIEKLAAEIIKIVGEDFDGSVGIRGLYETDDYNDLGDSARYEEGEFAEQLDGASTIIVSGDWQYDPEEVIVENLKTYADEVFIYGDHEIGLVVGGYGECGEEVGELLIPGARVIHTWEK